MNLCGKTVLIAFAIWPGEDEERKGRFVIKFSRQSKHWPEGSLKMETLESFALDLQENNVMMSWDVKGGCRHMHLHPDMRDIFDFALRRVFLLLHRAAIPVGSECCVVYEDDEAFSAAPEGEEGLSCHA